MLATPTPFNSRSKSSSRPMASSSPDAFNSVPSIATATIVTITGVWSSKIRHCTPCNRSKLSPLTKDPP